MNCANCDRRADYIFLDEDHNCLHCSVRHGFDTREAVFRMMVSKQHHHGYSWEEWATIANVLKDVDFGCHFDCFGGCTKRLMTDKRACCSDCAFSFGHLKTIPEEAVEVCMANFKRGNGFWTPQGCTLPWEFRSSTCLSYRCQRVREDEDANVWLPVYKAVGLGQRQFLPLPILPRKKQ